MSLEVYGFKVAGLARVYGFRVQGFECKFLLAQFRACRGILEGAYRFHLVQPPSMDSFPDGA